MHEFPPLPPAESAPEGVFSEGHLWILELVDGAPLRFQLLADGRLRFGDRETVYDDPGAVPAPYGHAVRHVREELDRDALVAAVDDVEAYVFYGTATVRRGIDYDWERTPSFLGYDVYAAGEGRFRPPDAVAGIFDRLGLDPARAVERERRARGFDPDAYELPDSAYYDGPAAGVLLRNKGGGRARIVHPDVHPDVRGAEDPPSVGAEEAPAVDADAAELARKLATDERFEAVAAAIEDRGEPVTFGRLRDRVLESILREEYHRVSAIGTGDLEAFRSAVAALTGEFLADGDRE